MKVRMLFWTGTHPIELPIREVIIFTEHAETVFEEYQEVLEAAVASGVAEVIDNLDL